ncbi:MAG: hypothetical protein ACTHQE_14815 [Thermomicrobiales bacterium]
MYLQKSFLARLLGAAWTILVVAVLLWVAVKLLQDVWIWVVTFVVVAVLLRIAFWLRRFRRDQW